MSSSRRLLLSLTVVTAFMSAACEDPPNKEMEQARIAIDAARAGGADRYAKDEYTAAEDALKHASEAVSQHDYRLALNNALDARERAQTAEKETLDRKASAQAAAGQALAEATTALNDLRVQTKTAETARASSRALAQSRRALADGETDVQKARTTFAAGDYLAATDDAHALTARLHRAAHDLDAATAGSTRRRH
jgi:hypothetical protein